MRCFMSKITTNTDGAKLSAFRSLFLLYIYFAYCVTSAQSRIHFNIKPFKTDEDVISTWPTRLDHFNDSDLRTFNQKYMLMNKFWKPGGPVFLYIEGEGPLSGPASYVGFLAKKHHALVVSLEHRYYGDSVPFDLQTQNLQWLSVKQALADLNAFTAFIKTKFQTGPWVCFGGSYAGALSAWYRVAYPNATVGALASSAVVHSIVAYKQYDQNVRQAVSFECAAVIDAIRNKIEKQARTPEGLQKLLALYGCDSDVNFLDFMSFIANIVYGAVQYSMGSKMCQALQKIANNSTNLLVGYSEISNEFWGKSYCREPGVPAWEWQTCTELGWFEVSPRINSLQSKKINLQYFLQDCATSFGIHRLPASSELNQATGGQYPKAKNVFFSNGNSDPWRSASVAQLNDPSLPSSLMDCPDCGHCRDLYEPKADDPPTVKKTRSIFEAHLQKWLRQDEATMAVARSRRLLAP